jgi:hypothetical protein
MCYDCDNNATQTANLPTLNVKLLRDLLTWAKQDKEAMDRFLGWGDWDQTVWGKSVTNGVCKTSFCMAGQAVVQVGYGLKYYNNGEQEYQPETGTYLDALVAYDCAPKVPVGIDERGNVKYELAEDRAEPIATVARRVLGFAEDEGYEFFDSDNSYLDLVNMANSYAARRGLDPIVKDDEDEGDE